MPRRYRRLLLAVSLTLCGWSQGIALASEQPPSLEAQITGLVNQGVDNTITRRITLLTSERQRAGICPQPKLALSGSDARLAGHRSVIAQCGAKRYFLQIAIQAEGTWWIANRTLASGTQILPTDLRQAQGAMDRLPTGLVLDKQEIIGRITTRTVNVGQPFQANQIRQNWIIVAGEEVDVQAQGDGFHIRTRGKAMDNAALNGALRVKTQYGQIVAAKALSPGKVSVSVQH